MTVPHRDPTVAEFVALAVMLTRQTADQYTSAARAETGDVAAPTSRRSGPAFVVQVMVRGDTCEWESKTPGRDGSQILGQGNGHLVPPPRTPARNDR